MWFSLTFPVHSEFPDFSLTGKCLPIFQDFPSPHGNPGLFVKLSIGHYIVPNPSTLVKRARRLILAQLFAFEAVLFKQNLKGFRKVWQSVSNDNTTRSCLMSTTASGYQGTLHASKLYLRQASFHREVHPVLSVVHRGGGLRGRASVPRVPVTDVTGGHRGVSVANGNITVDLLLLLLLLLLLVILILCWWILKADS